MLEASAVCTIVQSLSPSSSLGEKQDFPGGDSLIDPPPFIPFDTTPGSEYYKQFMQVYEKKKY